MFHLMGRIFKNIIPARLSYMAAALVLCAPVLGLGFSVPVWAQQGNPEVYVDMGALPPATSAPAGPAPIKLRPPTPKLPQEQGLAPRLTAPMAPVVAAPIKPPVSTPVVSKPPAPLLKAPAKTPVKTPVKTPTSPPSKVVKAPAPVPTTPAKAAPAVPATPIAAPVPVMAPVEEDIKPTAFPVETRIRKETTDPAANYSSRPVPLRSGVAATANDNVPSRPAPDFDPEGGEKTPAAPPVKPVEKAASSAAKPAHIPARKPASPVVATVAATAAPSEKTVAEPVAEAEVAVVTKQVSAPYVPPRRPTFVEKAPAELVAALRAREAKKEAGNESAAAEVSTIKDMQIPQRAIDLNDPPPPPGPRGAKNMPAVKKPAVEAEALVEQTVKLPVDDDPLLDRLVEKDKESLVATIESMVAAREDGTPLPKPDKIVREMGTSIVKAEPMQRPYNVYRPTNNKDKNEATPPAADVVKPEQAEVKVEEKADKQTAEKINEKIVEKSEDINTAAFAPRPPPPRDQDEQAYVSVPFKEGLTAIDGSITSEIEKRVLPIMNANPGWKLQIQAFASPVKDGASSARKASLARALSVRTYLLGKGIDATRMDVRALGAESDRDPMDRVDLIVFDPAKKG